MRFLNKFIKRVLDIIGVKILDNPLSFLGVTGFFILTLYLLWKDNGKLSFSLEELIMFGVTYIIALSIFMNQKTTDTKEDEDKINSKIEINHNNIGLINFIKNIKK